MKKKKGFTLVELLAVIVVLAIIALITVPTILGVIEKSRKAAYKDSIYGIIEAANIYLATNINSIKQNDEITFTCNGISCSNSDGDKLSFKGSVPKSGSFYIKGNGNITVESVYNGRYYANTVDDDIKITEEDTTLTRAELTSLVKQLQQQVNELQSQLNNKTDASQISSLKSQYESDVISIWNKVGTEDISEIGDGTISQILIDNHKLVSDLQTLVNGKVDATVTNNLSSQLSTLNSTVNSQSSQISSLNNTVSSHTTQINTLSSSFEKAVSYKGTYTGNIDELKNTNGIYWIGYNSCSGDYPFKQSGSFGYLIVYQNTQTFISYVNGKTASRTYVNNQWYNWGYQLTVSNDNISIYENNDRFHIAHTYGNEQMQLIFDYSTNDLIIAYYNGSSWNEVTLASW